MHFTNGETEARSGKAMYLVIAQTLGFSGWGVPRNIREGPCMSQFLGQVEAPLSVACDSIIVPVPQVHSPSLPYAKFLGKASCLPHILVLGAG